EGKKKTLTALAVVSFVTGTSPSSGENNQADDPTQGADLVKRNSQMVTFGHLPASVPGLSIFVEEGRADIMRLPSLTEIEIASQNPPHWNLSGNVLQQAQIPRASNACAVKADSMGTRIVVNGRAYRLAGESGGPVHNLSIANGVVMVNGKKLEPLAGADM